MTDSEKLDLILSRFDSVDDRLDKVDTRLDSVDDRLDKVDTRLDSVDEKLSKIDQLEKDITDIKLTLENEVSVNIKRVAEGHLDLSRRLHEATEINTEKEMMAIRLNSLENELRRLKQRIDQIA